MVINKLPLQARCQQNRGFREYTQEVWIRLAIIYIISVASIGFLILGCSDQQNYKQIDFSDTISVARPEKNNSDHNRFRVAVAAMIAKIGFDLVRSSTKELIDTALEPEEIETIRGHIFDVGGVRAVHMLRSRKSAGDAFVDVHIQVDPRVSVSEGHQIGETVRRRLIDEVDAVSDVTVHIDPEDDEAESPCDDLPSRETVLAELKNHWPQLPEEALDAVTLHYLSGEIHVELVLPINLLGNTNEASAFVERLKTAVHSLSYISDIQIQFKA